MSQNPATPTAATQSPSHYDVFISHASEDKAAFVDPLAQELTQLDLKVWYDKTALKLGDSLRGKIDEGLACSDYGVVILSHSFFAKQWTQAELGGLFAREVRGRKVILPVRHGLTTDDLLRYSPMLADKLAALTEHGVTAVAKQILDVVRPTPAPAVAGPTVPSPTPPGEAIPITDLEYYKEVVHATVELCMLKRWGYLINDLANEPPLWDSEFAEGLEKFVHLARKTPWPQTLPELEASLQDVASCGDAVFGILCEHSHLENEKYRGRKFYSDTGFNPNYERDLELYLAWIKKYNASLREFAKALNWFSDCVRTSINRAFLRTEGYFLLSFSEKPPKYTAAEIRSKLASSR
jgi:hypothetical protein